MIISELIAALQKIAKVEGDLPVNVRYDDICEFSVDVVRVRTSEMDAQHGYVAQLPRRVMLRSQAEYDAAVADAEGRADADEWA